MQKSSTRSAHVRPRIVAMMDPNAARPIQFTKKGDKVVTFLFYRVCYGMLTPSSPKSGKRPRRWQLPRCSSSRPQRPCRLAVATRAQVLHARRHPAASAIAGTGCTQMPFATADGTAHAGGDVGPPAQVPCRLQRRLHRCVSADLNDGNVHSLVWSAPGSGWEGESAAPSVAVEPSARCSRSSRPRSAQRPSSCACCLAEGRGRAHRQHRRSSRRVDSREPP